MLYTEPLESILKKVGGAMTISTAIDVTHLSFEQARGRLTAQSFHGGPINTETVTRLVLEAIRACADTIDLLSIFHDFNAGDVDTEAIVSALKHRAEDFASELEPDKETEFRGQFEKRIALLLRPR